MSWSGIDIFRPHGRISGFVPGYFPSTDYGYGQDLGHNCAVHALSRSVLFSIQYRQIYMTGSIFRPRPNSITLLALTLSLILTLCLRLTLSLTLLTRRLTLTINPNPNNPNHNHTSMTEFSLELIQLFLGTENIIYAGSLRYAKGVHEYTETIFFSS